MDNLRPEDMIMVPYHEAGHAMVGHLLGMPIEEIIADPKNLKEGGWVRFKPGPKNIYEDEQMKAGPLSREDLYAWLLINYGGLRAEELIFGPNVIRSTQDTRLIIEIDDLLTEMDGKDRQESGKYRDQASQEVDGMLKSHWKVLHELAKILIQQKYMSETEFLAFMSKFDL